MSNTAGKAGSKVAAGKDWACQECGRRMTARAAERASNSTEGCPGCGGSDIDLAPAVDPAYLEERRQAEAVDHEVVVTAPARSYPSVGDTVRIATATGEATGTVVAIEQAQPGGLLMGGRVYVIDVGPGLKPYRRNQNMLDATGYAVVSKAGA